MATANMPADFERPRQRPVGALPPATGLRRTGR